MKNRTIPFLICIAFYLAGVASFSCYKYQQKNKEALAIIDQRLFAAAQAAVSIIGVEYHNGIREKSPSDEEYMRHTLALSHMVDKAGLTYVYTMIERDGQIFFTSSSATAEEIATEDFSAFMDPYDDASDGLRAAFATRTIGYEIATDRWGTFRSVFIPQTAPDGTQFMVGADLSIDHLHDVARQSLISSVLTGGLFVVLILPLVLMLLRFSAQDKQELQDRIAAATEEILILNRNLEDHMHEIEREAERAKNAMADAERAREEAIGARRHGMLEAAETLNEIVGVLTVTSEALSAQIAESSRGSEEQAARLGETATAMEEMNATVLEVARGAALAAKTAEESKTRAENGARLVQKVVGEIADAERQTMALRKEMTALETQAEGIGRIMNVISDIADQTNLLALNAAIEAARAGDAGRGFAVVADEVRKLAEKTMLATKEVGEAVSGIQGTAKRTADSVDHTTRSIDATAILAKESGLGLTEIVGLADQTAGQIQAIATASEQQSSTSDEITRNIENVNAISLESSQAMREASQAVTELARQTQIVRTLVADMQAENHA